MKKILSIFSVLTVSSAPIATIVSCGVPTETLSIETKDGYKLSQFDNSTSKGKLGAMSIQLLEAITFTETKYQNKEKLKKQQETLGTNGLGLSLESYLKNQHEENSTVSEDLKNFEDSYSAKRNTNFSSIKYNGVVTKYNPEKIKTFEVVTEVESGKAKKQYLATDENGYKIKGQGTSLKEYFKDFAKPESETTGEEAEKKEQSSLTNIKKEFDERENTLIMGNFNEVLEKKFNTSEIVKSNQNEGEEENTPVKANNLNEEGWKLFFDKNNELIQSTSTFIHGMGNLGQVVLKFDDIKDTKTPREFEITYDNFENVVLRFDLKGQKIKEKKDGDKRFDTYLYWYQPAGYQFTDEKALSNSSLKDIFKSVGKLPKITIKKI